MEEKYHQLLCEQYRRMREEMKRHYNPPRDLEQLLNGSDDTEGTVGAYGKHRT